MLKRVQLLVRFDTVIDVKEEQTLEQYYLKLDPKQVEIWAKKPGFIVFEPEKKSAVLDYDVVNAKEITWEEEL